MEYIVEVLLSGTAAGAAVSFLMKTWITNRVTASIKHEYDKKLAELKGEIQTQSSQKHEKWLIKRTACLRALNLANAVLSNYTYPEVTDGDILPQKVRIEDARSCVDELACSCDSSDTLDVLKEIMFGSVTPDIIVDLRNAVRAELDFSSQEIDRDRKRAFIGKLNCIES